jgi:hypothetical protein
LVGFPKLSKRARVLLFNEALLKVDASILISHLGIGVKLAPGGEHCPLGVKLAIGLHVHSSEQSIILNEGVNIPPSNKSSPLEAKLTPRVNFTLRGKLLLLKTCLRVSCK